MEVYVLNNIEFNKIYINKIPEYKIQKIIQA